MANKRRRAALAALLIAASSISVLAPFSPAAAQSAPATTPAPAAPAAPAADAIPAATAADAIGIIQNFDDTLIGVMKQASSLGYDGRYAKFDPAIRKTFDVPFMTKVVVGPTWARWTQEQRDSITDAFTKFIVATYARRFDGFSGESFTVDGSQGSGAGMVVQTHLTRPNDSPVTINYLMRPSGNGWKAVDVFLTGSISELATRRSEFASVLERSGYSGLLSELQNKAKPGGSD